MKGGGPDGGTPPGSVRAAGHAVGVGDQLGGKQPGLEGVADAADHELVDAGVPLHEVQVGGALLGGAVRDVGQPAVDGLAFFGVVG